MKRKKIKNASKIVLFPYLFSILRRKIFWRVQQKSAKLSFFRKILLISENLKTYLPLQDFQKKKNLNKKKLKFSIYLKTSDRKFLRTKILHLDQTKN